MTAEEVKNLLKIYYDIPQMIDEEFAVIRHCEAEMNKITLPSVNLSGLPGGKGVPGDRTANMALADPTRYYNEEIKRCYKQIVELRDTKNWLGVALDRLDKTDRYILELAYMGDPDSKKRQRSYRRPPWKEIADKAEYSESQTRARATAALFLLADLSQQQVLSGMLTK
ncbi:MAG TPA: hypothetical protein VHO71_04890 [Caproiciproducens sp.]|nr:hypothetical protein [Caproiciproducens sp.]